MRNLTFVSLIAVGCIVGCGGGAADPTSPGNMPPGGALPANNVTVSNNAFTPATKTVAPGTTVTWTWKTCAGDTYSGQSCVLHNVTFDDGAQSSLTQDNGEFTRTFATAGTYPYHCTVHVMSGTVVVQQ